MTRLKGWVLSMRNVKKLGTGQGIRFVGQFVSFDFDNHEVLVTSLVKDDGIQKEICISGVGYTDRDTEFFKNLKQGDLIDIPLSFDCSSSFLLTFEHFFS